MQRPSGASRNMAHIDKAYYYVQQFLSLFQLTHQSGATLTADILTKTLGGPKTTSLRTLGGLRLPPPDIAHHFTNW